MSVTILVKLIASCAECPCLIAELNTCKNMVNAGSYDNATAQLEQLAR